MFRENCNKIVHGKEVFVVSQSQTMKKRSIQPVPQQFISWLAGGEITKYAVVLRLTESLWSMGSEAKAYKKQIMKKSKL